ncbi:hypothetical protein CJD36_020225 [Flavipsychrobacter stenotrophus]|uniref:Uncharacterized protein n=1 Tax=Flavipsychrobacter stenotrophus TaxID=2077091 RepID=A0A2S7SRF1_9BACT|nr:hypothetical protein [Flavipsychrobacter stenotrophus]PQJ09126.1 hypothetical protein CJD36_020225 [Flavipsychrobacter stenotrophus]
MIPDSIKKRIEVRFGKSIRYPKDCDALALSISNYCNEKISPATLVRIFGMAKQGPTHPRKFTLDLIAQYTGYNCWEDASKDNRLIDNSNIEIMETMTISGLNLEQVISFKYGPGSKVKVKYLGNNDFQVLESDKSTMVKDDILTIVDMNLHWK